MNLDVMRRKEDKSEKAGSYKGVEPRTLWFEPPVRTENCGGWWLSDCCGSVAEHWLHKPEVSWVQLPVTAGLFTFFSHNF